MYVSALPIAGMQRSTSTFSSSDCFANRCEPTIGIWHLAAWHKINRSETGIYSAIFSGVLTDH